MKKFFCSHVMIDLKMAINISPGERLYQMPVSYYLMFYLDFSLWKTAWLKNDDKRATPQQEHYITQLVPRFVSGDATDSALHFIIEHCKRKGVSRMKKVAAAFGLGNGENPDKLSDFFRVMVNNPKHMLIQEALRKQSFIGASTSLGEGLDIYLMQLAGASNDHDVLLLTHMVQRSWSLTTQDPSVEDSVTPHQFSCLRKWANTAESVWK